MTTPEKLKIIQRLLGLSQERLAQRFGVSFATFNSWINCKSTPRPKAQQQIEDLYLDISGQKSIPPEELVTKKEELKRRSSAHPNLLRTILNSPDIYDQFVLSLKYTTN